MRSKCTPLTFFLHKPISGLMIIWALAGAQHAFAQTYCTPNTDPSNFSSSQYYIDNFSTTNGLVNITNTGSGMSANGYGDFTAQTVSAVQGTSIDFSSDFSSYSNWGAKVWVDWNQDGDFDDSGEEVYTTTTSYVYSSSGTITVPATAPPGNTRMRIRISYIPSGGPDACLTDYYYGEAEDYTFAVLPLAPPDNAGIDSLVNPPVNGLFCSGNQEVKVRLRNLGNNILNNVNINWSIDDVLQAPVSYNTALNPIATSGDWAFVSLGTVNFPYNIPVTIKSWTSDPNGVTDNDFTDDTLTVTVTSAKQNVDVHINPQDTSICIGNMLILDAGVQPPGAIYVWNTGDVSQSISIDQGGVYSVKVQSLGGCVNQDTITITELPQPQVLNLGVVDNGGSNFTFTLIGEQNIDTYHWDFGDQTTDSGPGPKSHTYTQPGLYAAVITCGNSCNTLSFTRQIQVETTGISDISKLEQAIGIYPNPARDRVIIKVNGAIALNRVSVYNVVGQLIYTTAASGTASELNTSAFANGLYQVVIGTDKGQVIKKLEIVK